MKGFLWMLDVRMAFMEFERHLIREELAACKARLAKIDGVKNAR